MMKKKPLACAIGTVLLGMSFPSLAQMDAQNDTGNAVAESELTSTAVVLDAETDTAALAESMAPAVEEVVVTGSRISKDVF